MPRAVERTAPEPRVEALRRAPQRCRAYGGSMSAVFRRILVPTDFSEASDAAWQLARRLGGHDATLVALNVIAPLYPDVASSNVGATSG